jgi:hypothetical protein
MDKQTIFAYAKGVAVGNGTLTADMKQKLDNGDVELAVKILNDRKQELREGKNPQTILPQPKEFIESMIASVEEAVQQLRKQ